MIRGEPDVDLTLANEATEVGGLFRGQVVRTGNLDDLADTSKSRVRGVRLRLQYRTEGRGTTHERAADEAVLPADEFGRVNRAFELSVPPQGPISYDGRLIRVIWEIEVTVDIKRGLDTRGEVPVLVLPTNGFGLYQAPHPYRRRR